MDSRRETSGKEVPLVRFLERIRKSFSHDLRTPLGTIVNYAAVLEANEGASAEEVRDLGRRIRANAQRVARMVQLLATATGLAGRPIRNASTDLIVLAKSVLQDAGGAGRVLMIGDPKKTVADVDAEILGFAWRAFVAVQSDARGQAIGEAQISLRAVGDTIQVDLTCGADEADVANTSAVQPVLELPAFLRSNNGSARLENGMGLALAQDLVMSHGGELRVWGKAGSEAGIRVSLDKAAA